MEAFMELEKLIWDVRKIAISSLIPNANNPRTITKSKLESLEKSMDEYGIFKPILCDFDLTILGGNQRQRTLLKKFPGDYEVWVSVPNRPLTEREKQAVILLDNSQYGEYDMDLLVNHFEYELIESLDIDLKIPPIETLPTEGLTDEDDVPDVKEPIVKKGDLWLLGDHRLLCGDNTLIDEVERLMNGGKAELLFTSPPYSDMRDYGNHGNEGNVDIVSDFITSFHEKCNYLVFNLGIKRENHSIVEYWNEYLQKAKDTGLKFLSWNVWDKMHAGGVANQNAMFAIEHEWIFVFGDRPKKLNRTVEKEESSDKRRKSCKKDSKGNPVRLVRQKDGSTKFSSWGEDYEYKNMPTVTQVFPQLGRDEHTRNHPAVFPVLLPESYIRAMTDESQCVIDCFLGSGTTLIACEKTNRKCYGMDIDPHYCTVILNRWRKFTGREPILESTGQTLKELESQQSA
jgi:DNA modification methylase